MAAVSRSPRPSRRGPSPRSPRRGSSTASSSSPSAPGPRSPRPTSRRWASTSPSSACWRPSRPRSRSSPRRCGVSSPTGWATCGSRTSSAALWRPRRAWSSPAALDALAGGRGPRAVLGVGRPDAPRRRPDDPAPVAAGVSGSGRRGSRAPSRSWWGRSAPASLIAGERPAGDVRGLRGGDGRGRRRERPAARPAARGRDGRHGRAGRGARAPAPAGPRACSSPGRA